MDLKNIKDNLKKQFKINVEQIAIKEEKIRLIAESQLANRISISICYSLLPCIIITFLFPFLTNLFGISSFVNTFPPIIIPLFIVSSSLGIGGVLRKIITKISKTNENLSSFSQSKTELEKIIEEVSYKIEIEKLNNHNKILQRLIDSIELINFSDCKVNDSEQEIKQRAAELFLKKEVLYNELNSLSLRKVLYQKFAKINKSEMIDGDIIISSVWAGVVNFLIHSCILAVIGKLSLLINNISLFIPLLIGIVSTAFYKIVKVKNYANAFNILMNEFNLNKDIIEVDDINSEYNFNEKVEEIVNEICSVDINNFICQRDLMSLYIKKDDFKSDNKIINLKRINLDMHDNTLDDKDLEVHSHVYVKKK